MNGGVLIIGSLFWDKHRKNEDNIRKDWRDSNLDFNNAVPVRLPIRYGRKSGGGIFTMVFSPALERSNNLGVGYVVPFLSNPISNFENIKSEALAFAKAEGFGSTDNPCFYDSWGGSLGIIFNDELIEKKKQNEVLQNWKKNFVKDGGGKDLNDYRVGKERRSIDNYGRISIEWPTPLDPREKSKLDTLEFLIGASNKPKYSDGVYCYPKIEELIQSIKKDRTRYYFYNNLRNGITTYQDNRILKGLNE